MTKTAITAPAPAPAATTERGKEGEGCCCWRDVTIMLSGKIQGDYAIFNKMMWKKEQQKKRND